MSRPAILCVDDESTVLASLREQLRRQLGRGFLFETADSGEMALEIVDELLEEGHDLPVLIADQIMPGLKGHELLARVHARLPETRKIMLTGQASADAVGQALNGGGLFRYLSKPWQQDDLILTVRSAVDSYYQSRELAERQETQRMMSEIALDLTANLAATDRYQRLLRALLDVAPAGRATLYRIRDGVPVALATLSNNGQTPPDAGDAVIPMAAGRAPTWQRAEGRELLDVPLRVDGDTVGLLRLEAADARGLREVGQDRLEGFAALAAASLRTAELIDAIEASSAQRQRVADALIQEAGERHAGPLLGESATVRRLREEIAATAREDGPVLIIGPPGSGREAVARALHAAGPRSAGPFIAVSCALINSAEQLLGRADGHGGKLGLAAGGTLYLNGVEKLSPAVSRAVADAISAGNGAPGPANLVGSTVSAHEGRGPLTSPPAARPARRVIVPSLRDRHEDIAPIADFYLRTHAARVGRPLDGLSEASHERLVRYAWPGEISELSAVIERVVMTATGPIGEVDEAMLESGLTLGSYRLVEKLGAGGMGEVWLARHQHLARRAAVKLVRAEAIAPHHLDGGANGREVVERFRREAQATAELRSPHTVELYDFGVDASGTFYYVMELLEGIDLHRMVRRHGPLPPERVVFLLGQACLSLQEAHEAGLVHRDIKPANLCACKLGPQLDFLKVLDFGVVKGTLREAQTEEPLTRQGQVAGTPEYMAPEAALADGAVDQRSDIYALGCVAFWLLTGSHVFSGSAPTQILLSHVTVEPQAPSELARAPVPPELDALVLACLAKSPSDRPASAGELARRLGEIPLAEPWTQARAGTWWRERVG